MANVPMDALVIFGATGDLAKLETFPALVGLVDRGLLDVPVIGVAKSGWGLAVSALAPALMSRASSRTRIAMKLASAATAGQRRPSIIIM